MASLSDMPDDIIHHISSFLTTKEVTQLSILSKKYWKLICNRPTLVYDYTKPSCCDRTLSRTLERYRGQISSLHSSLVRYNEENIDLETFIFRADWWRSAFLPPADFQLYDSCINLGMQKGVRNLDLSMWAGYVLRAPAVMNSVVQFSAKYCRFQVEGSVMWPNLKQLSLIHAFVGNEAVFDNIIRGCPLLEILEIDFFNYEREVANLKFKVVNLHCLKKVRVGLGPSQSFELNAAPDLESLACRFRFMIEALEDNRSYRLDWIRQPNRYLKLAKLSLFNVRIAEEFFLHLAQLFPKLEHLSIKYSNLRRIKISSRTLKIIHLAFINDLQEAQFDMPGIVLFKLKLRYKDRMPKLSFTGNSNKWITRLRVRCCANISTWWFIAFKDLILTALKGSKTYLSFDFFGKVQFEEPNVTQYSMSYPGIVEIQDFYVNSIHEGQFSSSSFHAALDNIFWISRPRTVTFRTWGFYDYVHQRLLHGFLMPANSSTDGWIHPSKSHRSCECLWNVTGIEVFRPVKSRHQLNTSLTFYVFKEERGLELLPEASDCNKYVELLKVYERQDMVISGFNLEWRTCGMHTFKQQSEVLKITSG